MTVLILLGLVSLILVLVLLERHRFSLGRLLRRLFRQPDGSPSCLVLQSNLDELREVFRYIARRVGGRAAFDHWLQTIHRNSHGRQVMSCHILQGRVQYHFRVMPTPQGFAVTGHYEPHPLRHPLRHYLGVGTDLVRACADFRRFYDEWRNQKFHI